MTEEQAPTPPRASRLRRLAPVLLALGAAGALSQLVPHVPRERQVELRLDDAPTITSVELAWTRGGDAMQGASWRFDAGTAPRSILTTVRLPDGTYDLDFSLGRTDSPDVRLRRTITLADTERISLPLR